MFACVVRVRVVVCFVVSGGLFRDMFGLARRGMCVHARSPCLLFSRHFVTILLLHFYFLNPL